MALIIIKKRADPIVTSIERGREAQRIFMDDKYTNEHRIMIGGISVRKGLIDYIDLQEEEMKRDNKISKNEEALQQEHLENDNRVRALAKESIEYRAKLMHIPRILYQSYTGENNPPADFIAKVYERQLAYLREHPREPLANPSCYKDLLPINHHTGTGWEGFKSMIGARVGRVALESYAGTMRTAKALKIC